MGMINTRMILVVFCFELAQTIYRCSNDVSVSGDASAHHDRTSFIPMIPS